MTHRSITSFLTHDAPDGGAATLAQVLDARVREGELVERAEGGAVRCFACGHRCLVRPGRLALRQGARLVGSSYNEPLITAEWAVDVFKVARANGLKTAFISNGNATSEVLDYIRPWTDCYKIDFKAMDDKRYRELGGVLQHVLDAIRMVYERGLWLELVTLIVPGFTDSPSQLARAADYIAAISPEIPWHVTAF